MDGRKNKKDDTVAPVIIDIVVVEDHEHHKLCRMALTYKISVRFKMPAPIWCHKLVYD